MQKKHDEFTQYVLDDKLDTAFRNSDFKTCQNLIKKGANRAVLVKAKRDIRPFNRTMSQDMILRELL